MLLTNRVAATLDPWRVMRSLEQQWSQHVNDCLEAMPWSWTDSRLRLWAGDGSAVIEIDLPGVDPEAIELSVRERVLTVEVRPEASSPPEPGEFHLRERLPFARREVQLPFVIDSAQTQAEYRHGVLRVNVQQPVAHRPAKIAVKGC